MEKYAEIFGEFSATCSIPMLVLPESTNCCEKELGRSHNSCCLNYVEIFGVLDAGTFSLSYDEIFSMDKEEVGNRFLDETDIGQVETEPPELPAEVTVGHITFSKLNQICVPMPHANCGPDFEAETASPTGIVEDDISRNVASNDHILSGYMAEVKEAGKQREILNTCFVGATVDGSENYLNDAHKPPSNDSAYDLKQHSDYSSYHSTSSGDIPLSDSAFFTISDINLCTEPMEVPPPLRAPPNITFNRNYQAGGPRTRHALKETLKNTSIYCDLEVDASKAAAASAAAIIEAMEQAQASMKSAKELMERKQDIPQNDRRLKPYDFGSWNEQDIIFSGDSKHKTKKAEKIVPNQAEKVTSVFFEDAEEAIQGKESGSYKLPDEKERPPESIIDEQIYELVGSEKLIRNRVVNDEKYSSNEKEPSGLQGQRIPHGGDDNEDENKVQMFDTFKINEKTMFSEGELLMQDGNAKQLKSGIIIDKDEDMNIFQTSAMSPLQGNEDKQKIGRALSNPNEDIKKVVDTISLIPRHRNKNELKQLQESCLCADDKNNADDDTEPNACERNTSGLMDFCLDRKLEEFGGGESLEETLEHVKKTHLDNSYMEGISETSVVFEYDAFCSDVGLEHSSKADNCHVTSEFGINKKLHETKLSGLQNVNKVEVNMEATEEECQHGMLKQTKNKTYDSSNDGKDSKVEGIGNTAEQENSSFSGIDKTCEPVKKQRAKWNIPNRSELNVAKLFVQPVCLGNAKEALQFQKNEEKNVYELRQKFENYEGRHSTHGEQRKVEKKFHGKVQAALELEKKIMGLSATRQVQNSKAVMQTNSLDNKGNTLTSSVDSTGSSWKQMEKTITDEWKDANCTSKEILNKERNKKAEQKRKLEEKERAREQEKDMIAVEKATWEDCDRVFTEAREKPENIVLERVAAAARHRPITAYQDMTEKSSAEAFESSKKFVNEAKLWVDHTAVDRVLAKQALLAARKQMEISGNASNDKNLRYNEEEGIVRPGNKDRNNNLKPSSAVHEAANDKKSQSEGYEEESPLRCKARQERCQRIVERVAKALAEKNMRDLIAQREQEERNRSAEFLDAEVRRWSSGKEGNLRALLSTLQYILGNDSGWQPIPLTDVITAAAVRKAYRKATLYVHPDKLQQRGATIQHKHTCEKVFDLLKDAWNKFNSEGR